MDDEKIDSLVLFMCNSFIDKANEYACVDFEDCDDLKLAMISSSLIQASVKFTAYMLQAIHGIKLTMRKDEFIDEFTTRFNESLINHINEELNNKAKGKEMKNNVVFLDILKGKK